MAKKSKKPYKQKRGLSALAYAKTKGVAHNAVLAAIKTGRITASQDSAGRYAIDPKVADAEWEANTDLSQRNNYKGNDAEPSHKIGGPTFNKARAIRETFQAKLLQLEYEEKSGKLVNVERVKDTAIRLGMEIKRNLLTIPDRITHEVSAEVDPHKNHVTILRALNEALEALERELRL